jgi:hypothetical protein
LGSTAASHYDRSQQALSSRLRGSLGPGLLTSRGLSLWRRNRACVGPDLVACSFQRLPRSHQQSRASARMDVGDSTALKTARGQTLRRRFQNGVRGQTCGRKGAQRVSRRPRGAASNPVHSQAVSAGDDDTPSCRHCSAPMQLVRTIPRVGADPGLFVFRCTRCNRVATRQQHGPAEQP